MFDYDTCKQFRLHIAMHDSCTLHFNGSRMLLLLLLSLEARILHFMNAVGGFDSPWYRAVLNKFVNIVERTNGSFLGHLLIIILSSLPP